MIIICMVFVEIKKSIIPIMDLLVIACSEEFDVPITFKRHIREYEVHYVGIMIIW